MPLLSEADFHNLLQVQHVFLFSCPEAKIVTPHYFILIVRNADDLYFSCCTSQFESQRKLIQKRGWSEQTLVYIPETDADNFFHLDTYINCNEYFRYSIEEFTALYNAGDVKVISDTINFEYYEKIILGLKDSDAVEDTVKDILPNPDDLP